MSKLLNLILSLKTFAGKINKKYLLLVLAITVMAGLSFNRLKTVSATKIAAQTSVKSSSDKNVSLDKEFKFPIVDAAGREVTKISYVIQNAQLQDQIIIQGQTATAISGRTFLILNLKLRNDSSSGIQMSARDYIRLNVNNASDWLAADIHNDPVEVQPISTKFTRLGFPINKADKDFKLQIGEIKGQKTTLPITFN